MSKHILVEICLRFEGMCCVHLQYTIPKRTSGRRQVNFYSTTLVVQSSWNVMTHSDAREGEWRGNWRMEWVASTLHTTSEHGVSIITTADTHTSATSSRLNWRPRRFKWTRPFRRKTKSGFCACAITFQKQSTPQNYNWHRVITRGVVAKAWCWPPTPTCAEVIESLELYLYSLLWLHGMLNGKI